MLLPLHAEVSTNAPCREYDTPDGNHADVMMAQSVVYQRFQLNFQAIHLDWLNLTVVAVRLLLLLQLLRLHDGMRKIATQKMMHHCNEISKKLKKLIIDSEIVNKKKKK